MCVGVWVCDCEEEREGARERKSECVSEAEEQMPNPNVTLRDRQLPAPCTSAGPTARSAVWSARRSAVADVRRLPLYMLLLPRRWDCSTSASSYATTATQREISVVELFANKQLIL